MEANTESGEAIHASSEGEECQVNSSAHIFWHIPTRQLQCDNLIASERVYTQVRDTQDLEM